MKPGDIQDHLEIEQLLYRYGRAIDEKDYERLRSVFSPDAEIDYNVERGTALPFPEMLEWLRGTLPMFYATHHVMTNPLIEIDGDRARSSTYLTATHVQIALDGRELVTVLYGVYTDEHICTDAGWRIARRRLDSVHVDGEFLTLDRVRAFPNAPSREA